jgi:hypothetical protein
MRLFHDFALPCGRPTIKTAPAHKLPVHRILAMPLNIVCSFPFDGKITHIACLWNDLGHPLAKIVSPESSIELPAL